MSKARRTPGADGRAANRKTESEKGSGTTGLPNSLVQAIVETAVIALGDQDSLLDVASDELQETDAVQDTEPVQRRQQAAPLPEIRPDHKGQHDYADYDKGVAFSQGEDDAHAISPNDVAQGSLGDCYLMAAMVAVARACLLYTSDAADKA